MDWLKLLPAILKFILVELPKFLEHYRLVKKDKKYKSDHDAYYAALNQYRKSKDLKEKLKNLKKLE